MEARSWTYLDRSQWSRGEWDDEPDKMQWSDGVTGLPCLIVRNDLGSLCGYVGVTEGHPLFAIDYASCSLPTAKPRGPEPDNESVFSEWMKERRAAQLICDASDELNHCEHRPENMLNAHGGITFTNFGERYPEFPERGVYHESSPGETEPERVWWIGFDCAHYGDMQPFMLLTEMWMNPPFDNTIILDDPNLTYKDFEYVRNECKKIVDQLNVSKD